MGDDGVACRVTATLARDSEITDVADVITADSDVLRVADALRGRARIFVIDAMLDDAPPGSVAVVDPAQLDDATDRRHAHGLSPAETVGLLAAIGAMEPTTTIRFVTIAIVSADAGTSLSPAIERALPAITASVRQALSEQTPSETTRPLRP